MKIKREIVTTIKTEFIEDLDIGEDALPILRDSGQYGYYSITSRNPNDHSGSLVNHRGYAVKIENNGKRLLVDVKGAGQGPGYVVVGEVVSLPCVQKPA